MEKDLVESLLPLCRRMRKDVFLQRTGDLIHKSQQPIHYDDVARHIDPGKDYAVGQYLINHGESTCKVAVLDLDSHKGEVSWDEMCRVALEVATPLEARGLKPNIWRSGGGNGIHIWYLWDDPQDAYSVRALLRETIEAQGYRSGSGGLIKKQIEIYPKQDRVAAGDFGNQVWLPLRARSVPLHIADNPLGDGLILMTGAIEDAVGYEWCISQAVETRVKPERSPRTGATPHLDRLRQLLDHISDYTYEGWLHTGMAIHDATEGSEDGLDLWITWSKKDPNGYNDGDCESKWHTFNRSGSDGAISAASLEKWARDNGWEEDISDLFEKNTSPASDNPNHPVSDNAECGDAEPIAAMIRNDKDHLGIARQFIAQHYTVDGRRTLWRGAESDDWFSWNGSAYDRHLNEIITNELRAWLSRARKLVRVPAKKDMPATILTLDFNPTPAQITGIFGALKTAAAMPRSGLSAPQWIGDDDRDALDYLPLQDGLLHIPERRLLPHNPLYFTLNELPYGWQTGRKGEECPLWHKFLDETLPDQESIGCLQEIMGYLLTPDTRYQKMFLIKGLPRSGKGTIERVCRAMLGSANVVGTTLSVLGDNFGLWPLIDKSAVFISESRNTGGNMAVAIERLLMISGEDSVLINTKGGRFIEGPLKCRVIMTANEVPALGDSSGAFASRFITLTTKGSKLGAEDSTLTTKLLEELPGILRWSLDGLERLRQRGRFVQPEAGREAMEEMADTQNPIRQFLKECCDYGNGVGDEGMVKKKTLFAEYRQWLSQCGITSRTSERWFSTGLRNAYRELTGQLLTDAQESKKDGRGRVWFGITLKHPTDYL